MPNRYGTVRVVGEPLQRSESQQKYSERNIWLRPSFGQSRAGIIKSQSLFKVKSVILIGR